MAENANPTSNDTVRLGPHVSFDPPALTLDFPDLRIGVAEYREGPTGCTVFYFPRQALCAIDIRGGLVGVHGNYERIDALCFAGGSLHGLEAVMGVTAELLAAQGYRLGYVPLVNGAIVYDLFRENMIYPDKALGRAALKAACTGVFPLGSRGAGRYTWCGGAASFAGLTSESAGQGGAFRQVGPTKIAVFTVVNARGALVNRQGQVIRGNLDTKTGTRHHYHDALKRQLPNDPGGEPPQGQNTTLTVVVTNQKVNRPDQIGKQVHASMARAVQPFHTGSDGDVLYTVSTNEVENNALSDTSLGVLASELAWDAVLSCVQKDTPTEP